jgi:hypothetical protein
MCKGTGRKPNAPKAITFSALTTPEVKTKFLDFGAKLFSMMMQEGDSWGSAPLQWGGASRLTRDPARVPSVFYRGKWFTDERIDEMRDKNIYKEPEIDEKYLSRYLSEITGIASKIWPKVAVKMSGENRETLLGAVSYFAFLSSASVFDTYENRVVYSTRFKKTPKGPDRLEEPGRFVLLDEDSGGIKRQVIAEVDPECMFEDFERLLENADEVDLYYSILSSHLSTEQEEQTVKHSYGIRIAPYYAVVNADGKARQYVRTARLMARSRR